MSDLIPNSYSATLEDLKRQGHAARLRVQRKANTELQQLWWQIGRTILDGLTGGADRSSHSSTTKWKTT